MIHSNVSVIIVEDHSIIVEGLTSILQNVEGISFSGSFLNAEDAMGYLQAHKVNIILLDISLPNMSGIELCQIIKKQFPETKIIALTNHTEKSVIQEMLQNGADGYLLKNTTKNDLVNAIFQVMDNKFILQSELQKSLFADSRPAPVIPRLTTREKEILQLVSQGATTNAIAAQLYISPQTVETHRRNLMQKYEVNNSAALITKATQCGAL